jgi:hypothetical protein
MGVRELWAALLARRRARPGRVRVTWRIYHR